MANDLEAIVSRHLSEKQFNKQPGDLIKKEKETFDKVYKNMFDEIKNGLHGDCLEEDEEDSKSNESQENISLEGSMYDDRDL